METKIQSQQINSSGNKLFGIFVVAVIITFGAFVLWQDNLHQRLSKMDMACGGDWSYAVKCPLGSCCRSLGEGPLAGGVCRPWLSAILGIFGAQKEQVPTISPTPSSTLESSLSGGEDQTLPTISPGCGANFMVKDWNTFMGELSISYDERKFSICYPPSWKTEMPPRNGVMGFMGEDEKPYTVDLSLGGRETKPDPIVTEVNYAGFKARKYEWRTDQGLIDDFYVQFLDEQSEPVHNVYFSVPEVNQEKYLSIFDQILSTFKFTE